ncbi:hypothetical protein TNCV_4274361 [Trichonephila clavipes]|nr:hypothetical protein TNCV_4274361 [Trichonephila clavipes]
MDVNWDNVRFAIKPPVIVGLPCKVCVPFFINPLTSFFIRDGYNTHRPNFHSCLAPDDSAHILFEPHFHDRNTRDAAREARRLGICRSAGTRPCLHHLSGTQHETSVCLVLQRPLVPKKTLLDNFKRAILEAKHVNEFRPDDVLWEKISKGLLRNPDRFLKNTDKRMVYIYNNMFFVKKTLRLAFERLQSQVPSQPNVIRRSFEPHDQMLYHRTILEPHTAYPDPGWNTLTSC